MMNKVLLVGELVKNATISKTNNGSINSFVLATIRVPKDERKQNEVHFIYCKAFGKAISGILSATREGEIICVSGQIATALYTMPNGAKEYRMEIWAESIKRMPEKMADQKDFSNPSQMIGDAVRYYDQFDIVGQKEVHVLSSDKADTDTNGRDTHLDPIEKILGKETPLISPDQGEQKEKGNDKKDEKAFA